MKAQMPLMITHACPIYECITTHRQLNGLTNNKQNTFEPLLFIIYQRPVVAMGWPKPTVK